MNYHTTFKDSLKIDKLYKKYNKKQIIEEIEERNNEKEVKNVLHNINVKHPENDDLNNYSKRALISASFLYDKNKQDKKQRNVLK